MAPAYSEHDWAASQGIHPRVDDIHSLVVFAGKQYALARPGGIDQQIRDNLRLAGAGRAGHDGEAAAHGTLYGLFLLRVRGQDFQQRNIFGQASFV